MLIALTACGGGAAPNPVGGADLGSPRAITIQTIAPSPTPSPTPLKTATHVVVDGVAQPDFSNVGPPIAGSYTCSGSNLRMTAVDPVDLTEIFRK